MKILSFKSVTFLLLAGMMAFTSCKKDHPSSPAETMTGRWAGKYGSENPENPFAFNFLPNGVLQILNPDNSVKGPGSWTIEGNQFSGVYEFTPNNFYKFKGTYNVITQKISGVHGEDDDYDAFFFLVKQ